jgi:hypothetical protein
MKKSIAVWHDGGLTNAQMEQYPIENDPCNLAELALLALQHDITFVWVMPGSRLSQQVTHVFLSSVGEQWDAFASTSALDEKRPMFARIWRKKTSGPEGRTVYVGFPEHGSWPWKCPDIVTLLATVSYLEQATGMDMIWSPGYMALSLLKALNAEKRTAWLTPPGVDLLTLPINEENKTFPLMRAARDLTWKRALTAQEKRQKCLHKFDKNSMYLAATTGLLVGEGDPEHVDGEAFDERLPGFWRIQVDRADSAYDGINLPALFRYDWTTSAMVGCALKLDYKVEILEGYQWRQEGKYHRTLETWAKMLWEVRQELKYPSQKYKHDQGRANAYATIGTMAHIAIGKLADDKTSGGLYRPDIWALTVGRACANILYNIETYRVKGYIPVLIYTDALWFVSNELDPAVAVPSLLDKHDKLGGYKHVYSLPLSKEVKEAFATLASPTKLTTRLNELAGEE